MKNRCFSILLIGFVIFVLPSNTFAQDDPQWHLPEGAKARLGKGDINEITYSPDGTTIASGSWDGTVLLWELVPSPTSNAILSLSPTAPQSPATGQQLTLSLKIADAEDIAGYQATVSFDISALRYIESMNGDYLPAGAFFIPPVVEGNTVTLAASSLAGESDGDGTLATITFEVIAVKASTVRLTDVLLTDRSAGSSTPQIENAEISAPPQLSTDVNKDGIVNVIDLTLVAANFRKTGANDADVNNDGVVNIIDLTLVAAAFGNTAAAPEIWSLPPEDTPTNTQVKQWLSQARQMNLSSTDFQRGIRVLEQLLAVKLKNVLVGVLRAYWYPTNDLLTETEKLAAIASSIESTDWWDVEGDKEWDAWKP